MNGELRVVDDVPALFSELVAKRITHVLSSRDGEKEPFHLALSGGRSGAACARALALRDDVAFAQIVCYFVDERCVDPTSNEANIKAISDAFGERLAELGLVLPMSCEKGADFYDAQVAAAKRFDLIQLGLGPDGHTASLFPNSPGLEAPPGRLVVMNRDPSGNNPYERMTLTFSAIARSDLAIFTVIGDHQADALARIAGGEDLPAGRVQAKEVLWLVDRAAAAELPTSAKRTPA